MTALAYYLLKVLICSGVLFLFYLLALRNKIFHQWNRFYLLITVALSLALPLVQVTFYNYIQEAPETSLPLLQVVQDADQYMQEITITTQRQAGEEKWILLMYAAVSLVFFILLARAVMRVMVIVKTHRSSAVQDIRFVETSLPGTPFSFFHFIFWNPQIDLQSPTGQRIFKHELVHVKEKHSLDKLFIQLVLVVFWCNPFFWLIRRELRMIHEFIADKKSVGEHGAAALAAMILHAAYPLQFRSITNQFFQNSIKRRLHMLKKIQNPKLHYFSRIAALVLVAATVLAFTIRTKDVHQPLSSLEKPLTVVIDAGHGKMDNGNYNGARAGEINEDDITLAIAKKIQELNGNEKIRILLTRTDENLVGLQKRVEIAKENKADLFISLHTNASASGTDAASSKGIEVLLPGKNPAVRAESELLGSALVSELSKVYKVNRELQTRSAGIYVLNQSHCPAVLIECGNISHPEDRNFIASEENQKALALRILHAIERFAIADRSRLQQATDTLPKKKEPADEKDPADKDKDIFTRLDSPASIDMKAWRKFLEENLQEVIEHAAKTGMPAGNHTVHLQFIVERDGSLSNIHITKDPGYGIGEKILELMKKSPKWEPGRYRGKKVRSYHTQPITFVIMEESEEEKETEQAPQIRRPETYPDLKAGAASKMERFTVDEGEIISFEIVYTTDPKGLNPKRHVNYTADFDAATKAILASQKPGDIVTIENIIVSKSGKSYKHPSLLFQITE